MNGFGFYNLYSSRWKGLIVGSVLIPHGTEDKDSIKREWAIESGFAPDDLYFETVEEKRLRYDKHVTPCWRDVKVKRFYDNRHNFNSLKANTIVLEGMVNPETLFVYDGKLWCVATLAKPNYVGQECYYYGTVKEFERDWGIDLVEELAALGIYIS